MLNLQQLYLKQHLGRMIRIVELQLGLKLIRGFIK